MPGSSLLKGVEARGEQSCLAKCHPEAWLRTCCVLTSLVISSAANPSCPENFQGTALCFSSWSFMYEGSNGGSHVSTCLIDFMGRSHS